MASTVSRSDLIRPRSPSETEEARATKRARLAEPFRIPQPVAGKIAAWIRDLREAEYSALLQRYAGLEFLKSYVQSANSSISVSSTTTPARDRVRHVYEHVLNEARKYPQAEDFRARSKAPSDKRLENLSPKRLHKIAEIAYYCALPTLTPQITFKHFPPPYFQYLGALTRLNLPQSRIQNIPPKAFVGLVSLRQLDLSGNNILSLPSDTFAGLANLSYLNLNQNSISELQPRVFAPLGKLKELHIERNHIQALSSDSFVGLAVLETLNLAYNQIQIAPSIEIFADTLNRIILSYNPFYNKDLTVFSIRELAERIEAIPKPTAAPTHSRYPLPQVKISRPRQKRLPEYHPSTKALVKFKALFSPAKPA